MNRIERNFTLRKRIIRIEKQISAVMKSQRHLEYTAQVDSEYSVMDSLAKELEAARAELKALDLPVAEIETAYPTFLMMDLV